MTGHRTPERSGPAAITSVVRRAAAAVGVVAVAGLAGVVTVPAPAGAVTGAAELITVPGATTPLKGGGSATPYGVLLPDNASCPGDTAHDGYHVFSYLVPGSASPVDVSFKSGDPSRWFGYISDGAYFGAVNTALSTGQIVGIPPSFTWSRLTPEDLFSGGARTATWEGGIACANTDGVVTDYWNSQIVFTADSSDPGGFTWKVVGQAPLPSSFDTGLWVGVGLLVVASAAAAYALRLRRRGDSEGPGVASAPEAAPEPRNMTNDPQPADR
ncbi:MAG: hypothetical protein ABSF84_15870 [Acidimicrobiales bacterium]